MGRLVVSGWLVNVLYIKKGSWFMFFFNDDINVDFFLGCGDSLMEKVKCSFLDIFRWWCNCLVNVG